ncbi:MAG: radical SAM protein [Ferruginibacter sp.]|nr:radical SAM protein [Ferruginibacter sp.]
MKTELDTILIKVASRCNINCSYCYVYNMGDDNWSHMEKLISSDTINAICEAIVQLIKYQSRKFSIVLHGGEPLLLGVSKLDHLLTQLRNILSCEYPISIQTNGILISNQILDVCAAHKVSVAVSIDGPKDVHNKYRINHKGDGTFEDVLNGIAILKTHKDSEFLNAGLLAVVDPLSNPKEIYNFFKSIAPPSVDFLYKDGNHTNLPINKSATNSTEYGVWMTGLLKEYLNDTSPLPIRVLDDMIKVMLGGDVSKEGLGLTDFGIIIIDTDGTIMKNDTLKSTYNGADKFSKPINIRENNLIEFLNSGDYAEYREMQRPTNHKCKTCAHLHLCGGGMILHRWSKENQFNNPSVYCSDQLLLIENMIEELANFNIVYE